MKAFEEGTPMENYFDNQHQDPFVNNDGENDEENEEVQLDMKYKSCMDEWSKKEKKKGMLILLNAERYYLMMMIFALIHMIINFTLVKNFMNTMVLMKYGINKNLRNVFLEIIYTNNG